jgi:hypothetical protein
MKKLNIYFEQSNLQKELVIPGEENFSFLGDGESNHKKCLPIKIASQLGWDMLMPETIKVIWNGGNKPGDIKIIGENNTAYPNFVCSQMGYGILTITIPYLFEVEDGNFLWFRGCTNNPISPYLFPIEGLVEYDWFPSNVTMNFKITIPNVEIVMPIGAPYCRVLPYPKKYIEEFKPVYSEFSGSELSYKWITYNMANKFMASAKNFLMCYSRGIFGDTKINNVKKIKLDKPNKSNDISKCPFHKLFKK